MSNAQVSFVICDSIKSDLGDLIMMESLKYVSIIIYEVVFLFRFSSNMSKTRASASSRVPNTEKQMRALGRSAFICFEVFGTRDEARSPSF